MSDRKSEIEIQSDGEHDLGLFDGEPGSQPCFRNGVRGLVWCVVFLLSVDSVIYPNGLTSRIAASNRELDAADIRN